MHAFRLIHLQGETAKSIFERAQLPNETLGRIWALADAEQKGALGLTEFIIAMHLLASMKSGSMRAVPQALPAGLYEAAARRGAPRQGAGSRPTSDSVPTTIPRQFSGAGYQGPPRSGFGFQQPTAGVDQWLISPQDKSQFDSIFMSVDTQNRGFITGDQAVGFFSNSRLPEEALAQIWDLADINSEGQLNRDEFAVAMYLIRQQKSKIVGREVLPQQLPPNLIPPSMRRQPRAPQQPTAPTFDNAANITAPKSASEDLFGLDAASTQTMSAPLQAKSTGDSSAYTTPPRNQASPPPTSAPSTSHFKPFVPSSSFGQTIMKPQGTGNSRSASPAQSRGAPSQQKQANAIEDLLGDNDPEISKKLTTETADLANLSNQVGTLTSQMQDTQNKRGIAEQELGQAQNRKAQFEVRLAELRTAYEQEVSEVQVLEERLQVSRIETKRLQSDMAMIRGTHEDLKTQHRQVGEALTSDQNENNNLKERIRLTSTEIEQLKPQLEKLRSEARHQKGLVAINKKQLATHEAEREKAKSDIQSVSEEYTEATRDLRQSQRDLESVSQPRAATIASSISTPGPAPITTSPSPSTGSMNPFFRRPSNPLAGGGVASSPFTPQNVATPNHNAFDSFFGSSAPVSTAPPPTSFRSETPNVSRELPHETTQQPLAATGTITPSASPPPSSSGDSPVIFSNPPAPPESRQITSSFLPLRPKLEQSESESSSIKVLPPASRAGERSETPPYAHSEATIPESPKQHFQELAAQAPQAEQLQLTPSFSDQTPDLTRQETTAPATTIDATGLPSAKRDVPGAFPGDETPIEKSEPSNLSSTTSPYNSSAIDPRVHQAPQSTAPATFPPTNPLAGVDSFVKSGTPTSSKGDFDSAFEGFSNDKGKAPEKRNGAVVDDPFRPQPKAEFPPIKEFGGDIDSDSDSEKGFDDDFTTRITKKDDDHDRERTLPKQALLQEGAAPIPPRPAFTSTDSNKSQLPTPGAQASPPTYDQSVGTHTDRKGSNPFPAEYTGLLPSRDDPTSPPSLSPQTTKVHKPDINSAAGIDRGMNFFPEDKSPEQANDHTISSPDLIKIQSPMSPGASTSAQYAYTHTSLTPQQQQAQEATKAPAPPAKIPSKDDFDDFEDLAPAQEEDSKESDDTLDFSRQPTTDLDFNPTFDSPSISSHAPAPSQSSSSFPAPPKASDSFTDFTSSITAAPPASARKQQMPTATVHDWDAIFAGLDTAQEQKSNNSAAFGAAGGGGLNGVTSTLPPMAGGAAAAPETDDDDPILKRLIGMGFARGDSLSALEKFDYNIDKVRSKFSFFPSVTLSF